MAEKEIYKGIEFIRVSNLPKEQIDHLHLSFPKERIIKILRDEVILKDCIQYHDYLDWFRKSYKANITVVPNKPESILSKKFALTVK